MVVVVGFKLVKEEIIRVCILPYSMYKVCNSKKNVGGEIAR
jgi:hypothetical protein